MSPELTRRDFVAAATAFAGAALWPAPAPARAAPRVDGSVVLFQGDSITDSGRQRGSTKPNTRAELGTGYPLLAAAAALGAHPERALRCYNRGVSGHKVPDLQARWQADALELKPDVLSILVGVNDFWHTLHPGGLHRHPRGLRDAVRRAAGDDPPGAAAGPPRDPRAVRAAVRGGG